MAEDTKDSDNDVDLYCDLEEIENGSKANEENSDANGLPVPDISTLFSENECMILFSEDGKKTKVKIKRQADCDEDGGNSQSPVKDLDLFTDVVTEKFVQAEQEKLQRETLISHNIELKKLNSQLETNINLLMKKNRTLMRNICALYKTAKEEMSRKDALIADLREKNDAMIFRRRRLLGANNGPAWRYSKFQRGDNATADDAQQLNGKNSEFKANQHGVTDSHADGQATVEECNSNNFRNPGQSSDASSLGNTHKHNSERRKKLPKAFQDPEKLSHRRHSSHKAHFGKRKRYKIASKEMHNDSEGSLETHFSHSSMPGNSSESDADQLFHETFRDLKKSCPPKKRHKKSVLSNEELRRIYSDYQSSLVRPKSRGENREKEQFSASTSGNFNKSNMNSESENSLAARNNLFEKLLSYEKRETLQESERNQKHTELKRIISHASDVEDFTQLYSKYLAQWALSSVRPSSDSNNSKGTSGLDDFDDNDSDYPAEGDYEEDYDENYEYYSSSKYVDLDKPHDNFYGAPRKSFYDHLMEEKVRQVHMYHRGDFQTGGCALDSSKVGKLHGREDALSASHLPEALKGDSLKLFSYQGKPVPIAVKKKVLGYAKSPKKIDVEKK